MAYNSGDNASANGTAENSETTLTIDGQVVELPDASFVRDADITRDGADLVLEGPNGTVVIEGYFTAEPTPNLVAPDGATLTPELVESFSTSPAQYASTLSMSDQSPVGTAQEISGEATVTRADGSVETVHMGTAIYQGDIIETSADGAVNIVFIDETSFAVSEDARLAIDEYVFDPATQSGTQNFSVLKGVFVFTSGLIGRDDPDDVGIDTPVGSIGIRGTIIAGDVNSGEITVVEGAIVLTDNAGHEMTLASQFETARFATKGENIENLGQMSAEDVGIKFASVSQVSPSLFSSINDAATETHEDAPAGNEPEAVLPNDNTLDGNNPFGELTGNDPLQEPTPPPTAGSGDPPPSGEGNTPPPPPGAGDPPPPPPLGAEFSVLNISNITEITPTTTTAAVPNVITINLDSGLVSDPGQVSLVGKYANIFDISHAGGTQYDISLLAGVNSHIIDFDVLSYTGQINNFGATVQVVDDFGVATQQFFNVGVNDVNEAAKIIDNQPLSSAFMSIGEGMTFTHNFDLSLIDLDFADQGNTTFSITDVKLDGVLTNIAALESGPLITSITFNPTDTSAGANDAGLFSIGIGNITNLLATNVQDYQITFDITLGDSILESPPLSVTLNLFAVGSTYDFSGVSTIDGTFSGTAIPLENITALGSNGADTLSVGAAWGAHNNTILLGDGNDTVDLTDANNNIINLGEGDNTIIINQSGAAFDNVISGGSGQDIFDIKDVRNHLHGADGDDNFILDLSISAVITEFENTTFNPSIEIQGGHSDFRAGASLDGLVPHFYGEQQAATAANSGRGDSLTLVGAGDLNFTNIDDSYIKGIERIDANNSTSTNEANQLTLSYTDIINMTDFHNTLIINLDGNDALSLTGSQFMIGSGHGQFELVADDLSIDDGIIGTPEFKDYDVYSNGNVTLLISISGDGSGGGGVSFVGANVAI